MINIKITTLVMLKFSEMISHNNFQKKEACIYNSNIDCLMNFSCDTCPIGCNAELNKAINIEIEDIIPFKSYTRENNNLKSHNRRKLNKSKHIDTECNNEALFLNNNLQLVNTKTNKIENDNKVEVKNKLLTSNKIISDNVECSLNTHNVIEINNNNIYKDKIFTNYEYNNERRLILSSSGKLLIIKLSNLLLNIPYCLFIILGESFAKLFIEQLMYIS